MLFFDDVLHPQFSILNSLMCPFTEHLDRGYGSEKSQVLTLTNIDNIYTTNYESN